MKSFQDLELSDILAKSLTRMGYNEPTPIQSKAIPVAFEGRDILGSAQTGTGKTAAFAIPLIESLLRTEEGTALVLTPTRELGKQVMDTMLQLLGPKNRINTAFIIGGESKMKQIKQLERSPRLIVGTPGRINDHLQDGTLNLSQTHFLVLDETDRMLDMGFSVQLDRIAKYIPKKRQTLMFSATLPKDIMTLASKYLNNPERISVGSTIEPAKNIQQDILRLKEDDKYTELVTQLYEREGSIVIFVKTKFGTEKLAKKLIREDFSAAAIHGDLKQNKRTRVIRAFRNKEHRILVATDVIARGLDIPHIEHVINYDLPQDPEDYIHRIGRTARAGKTGSALCLISPQDGRKWSAIQRLMNPSAKHEKDERPMRKKRPMRGGRGNNRFQNKPKGAKGQQSRWGGARKNKPKRAQRA